jgi:hypothetical protein
MASVIASKRGPNEFFIYRKSYVDRLKFYRLGMIDVPENWVNESENC